jgi:site-specific DNA-methyltransferase (adenine-specific)
VTRCEAICGDAAQLLAGVGAESVDLIYLDPPFGTGTTRHARQRHTGVKASFGDSRRGAGDYTEWLRSILEPATLTLKASGALFVHCDWRVSHHVRVLLDELLGAANFRNEIIWHYRRWTAATESLQRLHQTIYYYARSRAHSPTVPLTAYSPATNLDQIWQTRTRSAHQPSVYALDGERPRSNGAKRGVPLGDVWEIPPLNPTARERVGYPTQKPLALLERIVELASSPGGLVLDPCCGSGTTLVAAKLLSRRALGFDTSARAIELTRQRLVAPVRSRSQVMDGRGAFERRWASPAYERTLALLDAHAVQRSKVIHGYLSPAGLERLGLPNTWSVPLALADTGGDGIADWRRALARLVASKRSDMGLLLVRPWPEGAPAGRPTDRVALAPWPADVADLDALRDSLRCYASSSTE